jgi:putative restriction endonuclease
MSPTALDIRIREAALAWCEQLRMRWGDHVPAKELNKFPFDGDWLFLAGQQGIFKPKLLDDGPLSIRTVIDGPYNDSVARDGETIRYDFSNISWMNDGLKRVAEAMSPVIYLVQVNKQPSEYLVISPAFITDWNDAARVFQVAYQPTSESKGSGVAEATQVEKRYGFQLMKSRLHQAHFRKAVLTANKDRCAVCELRVRPLLDGAHIIPDSVPGGDAIVQNGLSLCANHHRAYDRRILMVRGDYTIEVDQRAVKKRDSEGSRALLDHQGKPLRFLPKERSLWPDPDRLERVAAGL